MTKLLFLLLISFEAHSLETLSCPAGKSLKKMAFDIVRADLSGARVTFSKKSCFNQTLFPHYRLGKVPSNESVSKHEGLVLNEKKIKIKKVKTINEEIGSYEAYYDVSLTSGKKIQNQKISFLIHKSEKAQSLYGCVSPYEYGSKKLIFKSCLDN